jgi:hypothetical protein
MLQRRTLVCQAHGGYPGTRKAGQKMIEMIRKALSEERESREEAEVVSRKKIAEDAVLERSMHACC